MAETFLNMEKKAFQIPNLFEAKDVSLDLLCPVTLT